MHYGRFCFPYAVVIISVALIASGCASEVQVTNTLPDRLKDSLQPVTTEQGVVFDFVPIPAGEQFQISVGAMDYSLNRVFEGMLIEMLETKFGTLQPDSPNRVRVQVNYLNAQEESYGGTLNRIDMAVKVGLNNGFRETEKELEFSETAEVEGYGLQSGQLRNLLLRFTLEINRMIDDHYANADVSRNK